MGRSGIHFITWYYDSITFFKDKNISAKGKISLKNVRLETGFTYEDGEVVATKTDLFCVEVENGKITKVAPNQPSAKG